MTYMYSVLYLNQCFPAIIILIISAFEQVYVKTGDWAGNIFKYTKIPIDKAQCRGKHLFNTLYTKPHFVIIYEKRIIECLQTHWMWYVVKHTYPTVNKLMTHNTRTFQE